MTTSLVLEPGGSVEDAAPSTAGGSFPIVAVGASAGGLAPTTELLRALGAEPGLAVIVIHHLDPLHESSLTDILSRATSMPLVTASDGALVEPNRVYVMPPNAGLLIQGGRLQLTPRVQQAGLHLPINRFFGSLAVDCEARAVGVVLSGSGYDGTEGIRAIKREGGVTLAQDTTAQYGSMPDSAVASGCVDFVLPPSGLARELIRLAAHAPALEKTVTSDPKDRDYLRVLLLMRRASGVDFTSYKHSTIRRRIERRLFFHALPNLAAYLALLEREPAEIGVLCEEVLIHVTGFFRDPEAFAALTSCVFPRLREGRAADAPLRVWVPGCSTGEEVYSIAICLLEFLADAKLELPIKIFGTDLSLPVIETARAGRYPESIEAEVSPERLKRFFSRDERGYQIRRDVRERCVFARHDVSRDPPFSAMDLISCRNLMIYLGPELQERVIALLHYALREPGFLLLGGAESVRSFVGFRAVDAKHKIYARTSAAPALGFDFTRGLPVRDQAVPGSPGSLETPFGPRAPGQAEVSREADRLLLAEFAPPGLVVTEDFSIVQFRGKTGPFLEHAPGAASLDLLRAAREELRLPLRRALDQARANGTPAREADIGLFGADKPRSVTLEVSPFLVHSSRLFLVLFREPSAESTPASTLGPASAASHADDGALQKELASTRQYLESVVEQLEAANEELKAANEEIVSSNEELRSGNEELESAKEELQATNEELRTLNDEMRDRNLEATRLSDDLTNVLSSSEIPMLITDRDAALRRFTPAAGKVFGLGASDVGHPLSELQRVVTVAPTLSRLVKDVLGSFRHESLTIQDASGRFQELSVRPYITLDGRIDGTVIAGRDIDAEKRSAEALVAARKYAEDVVDAVREGLVVLDRELRVVSANKAFVRAFALDASALVGCPLADLGCLGLARPALSAMLQALATSGPVNDFRLERVDATGRRRVFLLNARHIDGTELCLLAAQDVTEIEAARGALQRAQLGDVLIGAVEGVLLADVGGHIFFANQALVELFGYTGDELLGLSVDVLVPEPQRSFHVKHRAEYAARPSARSMGPGREVLGRRKDGTPVTVEVTLNVVARDTGPVVVAFVRDITKQRQVEADVRAYQDRLQRMSFEAVVSQERERRRIAIELHDRMGQALALAQIKLKLVSGAIGGEARDGVDEASKLLEQAIVDSRELIFELSPPLLYDLGLKEALAWLAEDLEKRHGIKVEVVHDGADLPLDDAAKGVLFRAARELLMNVLKHSQVAAAKVSLRRSGDQLEIDVEDEGVGFDLGSKSEPSAPGGFGLLSLREQLARLGGELRITSAAERGTTASVRVPLRNGSSPGRDAGDGPSGASLP